VGKVSGGGEILLLNSLQNAFDFCLLVWVLSVLFAILLQWLLRDCRRVDKSTEQRHVINISSIKFITIGPFTASASRCSGCYKRHWSSPAFNVACRVSLKCFFPLLYNSLWEIHLASPAICDPTMPCDTGEWNASCLNCSQANWYPVYLLWRDGRLSWSWWFVI